MMKTFKSLIKNFLKLFVRVEYIVYRDTPRRGELIVKYSLGSLVLFTKYYKSAGRKEHRLFDAITIRKNHKKIDKLISQTQNNYPLILSRIRTRVAGGGGIRVGFLVLLDSMFSFRPVFEAMLKDSTFAPLVIVIPDTLRGEKRCFDELLSNHQRLLEAYPTHKDKILCSYDWQSKKFIDFAPMLDVAYFNNPYDLMTHRLYSIGYLSQFTLTLHISYGYMGLLNYGLQVFASLEYSLLWNIYVENQNVYDLIKSSQVAEIQNLKVIGYLKMDKIQPVIESAKEIQNKRKKIIIAPHHTLTLENFPLYLSNFLRLSDFYLNLPSLYPQIDFIFRPHPLLFTQIIIHKAYGEDSQSFVENYLKQIEQIPNMIYQEGGEYFESFATSSALIHDCGSFIAEYLYTDKPEAFIIESNETIKREFTPFGEEVLKHLYLVSTEKDIIDFIDSVVLQEQDFMKQERITFAKEHIRVNYPNATQIALNDLKQSLGIN